MTRTPPIKLSLAMAVIAMLIAIAAFPGVTPRGAEATVNSIGANDLVGEDGDNINVTITGTDDAGDMVVDTNSNEVFTLVSCSSGGSCAGAVTGSPGPTITLDTVAIAGATYTLTLSMALDCTSAEVIRVTADDDDNTRSLDIICIDDDDDPEVIVEKEANDDDDDYGFDWDADGTCAVITDDEVDTGSAGSFELEDDEQALFFCDDSVDDLVVEEDDDGNFSGIVGCDEGDDGVDDISGSTVSFDLTELSASETVSCTWVNEGAEATATAVAGPVTSVQVTASNIAACGGSTPVQVFLRNASGGPAPAGTSVTASSSAGGTFQPASTLTGNFAFSVATFVYQAPPTFNGVATITARTSNNVSGSVNVQVVCGAAAPAPAPTTPAGPLRPPSAGSGGLLGGGGSGGDGFEPYLPSALAASIAALILGVTLATGRRSIVVPVSISLPGAWLFKRKG